MITLKKKKGYKRLDEIQLELRSTFNQMIKNKGDFYFITITKTNSQHAKDLNFLISNHFFNKMWKDYKHTHEFINYLFVIEYPEAISKIDKPIDKLDSCRVHSHILLNTSLSAKTLDYYLNTTFNIKHIKNIPITNRPDKEQLINYFLKQNFLNEDCYNYKVIISNS